MAATTIVLTHLYQRFLSFILMLFLGITAVNGQDKVKITGDFQQIDFSEFVQKLEGNYPVKIFYPKDSNLINLSLNKSFTDISLESAFKQIFSNSVYLLKHYQGSNYVVIKSTSGIEVEESIATAQSGEILRLNGYIRDANTNEPVIGVTVYVPSSQKGVSTDASGYFELNLPPGSYDIRLQSIGYQEDIQTVDLNRSTTVSFSLYEKTIQLEGVTISEKGADENISSTKMGTNQLSIKTIRTLPPFLGEVDIFRSLLLLPGVSTVGEGAAGFNVRGGSVDQNLILLDGVPVFNPNHFFGFFSSVNGDIVKNVTLHKGGISARYGGRLASIMEIDLKDGNNEQIKGSGGVGLISARLNVEGPIIKDKSTFVLSGRTSYSNWLLRQSKNPDLKNSEANFSDANAKLFHRFDDFNSLSVSGYFSTDGFKFAFDTTYQWQNLAGTFNWNHLFNDRLVGSLRGSVSRDQYDISSSQPQNSFNQNYNINQSTVQTDFSYFASERSKWDFGLTAQLYRVFPGQLSPGEDSQINPVNLDLDQGLEYALYLNNEISVLPRVDLMMGLRWSHFHKLGPGTSFQYEAGLPRAENTITDTLQYGNRRPMKYYHGLEPRFSARIGIDNRSSIKVGYNRMRQYIHLISNTTAVTPIDIWKLSNNNLAPQISDQLAVGYFRNYRNNTIETSLELYYKKLTNILDYKDGADLFLNNLLEQELLAGEGKAYGAELMINKTMGRLTGWFSYTYSRTLQKFDGDYPELQINRGEYFPSNFDKPHEVTVSGTYRFSRRVTFSSNFTYSTGRPITLPEAKFSYDGYLVVQFSDRNKYRIPDYHRLDLSLTIEGNHKRDKNWHGSYTFSIFNVYGRKNPYSVFIKPNGLLPQAYKLAVLGVVFPSFTYNFKF